MAYLSLKNVTKEYHSGEVTIKALSGVNLEIEEGELCVIVGPSGAGKTTLLNILGGMDCCTGGESAHNIPAGHGWLCFPVL